ncbi:MAG: TapY2 family type IVa secretion system protein [Parashewanella sp.]
MNQIKWLVIVGFSCISFASFSNEYVDYKCYLDTTAGKQLLYFSWKKSQARARLVNLPVTKIVIQGSDRVRIKDVIECIERGKNFKNKTARKLEKQQVF